MSNTSVHGAVDRATDNKAFEYTARVGFAASGVLHLLVAFIILRLAFGSGGGNADQSGALGTLAKQPGGTLMLWVAAAGLVALGLWRIAEAVVGSKPGERSGQQKEESPAWKRAKSIGLAIVNFAIAFSAAKFAMGSGQSSGQQNAGMSAELMQSGWGKALLIAVLLIVLCGCDLGATRYEVLDRFHISNPVDPNHEYFLWLRAPDGKAFDRFFPANERAVWDGCWLGDTFIDRVIGKDECVRTAKSEMPTKLRRESPGSAISKEQKYETTAQDLRRTDRLSQPCRCGDRR